MSEQLENQLRDQLRTLVLDIITKEGPCDRAEIRRRTETVYDHLKTTATLRWLRKKGEIVHIKGFGWKVVDATVFLKPVVRCIVCGTSFDSSDVDTIHEHQVMEERILYLRTEMDKYDFVDPEWKAVQPEFLELLDKRTGQVTGDGKKWSNRLFAEFAEHQIRIIRKLSARDWDV